MSKKEEILEYIKKSKRVPTTRISGATGTNLEYTKRYLEELEKEGKIKRIEETTATYWGIRGEK